MQLFDRISFARIRLHVLFSALGLALLLNGCASNNRISQDFKPDTNFKSVKTFSWHNVSSEIPNINNVAIQKTIEEDLTQRGFQLVAINPDVVLDLNIIAQKSSAPSTGLGVSLGLPIGNHGSVGLGTSKLLARDNKQEGLIVLDITTHANNQVIWRGTADAIPMSYFLLRNEPQLNAVLKRLVAQFPPK